MPAPAGAGEVELLVCGAGGPGGRRRTGLEAAQGHEEGCPPPPPGPAVPPLERAAGNSPPGPGGRGVP